MPINYSFDQERQLVLAAVSGPLTIAVTMDYFGRLQQDTDCPAMATEIVDFTDVTDFALQYGEMRVIKQKYQTTKSAKKIWATVFHCTSQLSYGIARMLRTLHEIANENHKVIITRTHEELTECIEQLRSSRPDAVDSR